GPSISGVSSDCVQATLNLPTFEVLIWSRVENRPFPRSPLLTDQSLPLCGYTAETSDAGPARDPVAARLELATSATTASTPTSVSDIRLAGTNCHLSLILTLR